MQARQSTPRLVMTDRQRFAFMHPIRVPGQVVGDHFYRRGGGMSSVLTVDAGGGGTELVDGVPRWHVSVAFTGGAKDPTKLLPTAEWTPVHLNHASKLVTALLQGVGTGNIYSWKTRFTGQATRPVSLAELAEIGPAVDVRCDRCKRRGSWRVECAACRVCAARVAPAVQSRRT